MSLPCEALHFPEAAEMPESKRHLKLRTFIYEVLERTFGDRAAIGSDQFVYYRANDPRKCVAPDAFVCMGGLNDNFPSWKTWERGAPQLAVEIASPHEPWEEKLVHYREAGVLELVLFDPEAEVGQRLRIWHREGEQLVERAVVGESAPAVVLGGSWLVGESPIDKACLRLKNEAGELLLSEREARQTAERERQTAERERQTAERERQTAERERQTADARAAELEAEVRRLRAAAGR